MDRLVTFGDSWPCGAELSPFEKPYGAVLAALLELDFENHAQDATSNEHMILQLKRYIDSPGFTKNTVAVFFITSPARACLIDFDGTEIEIYPRADPAENPRARAWYKFFHTPQQDEFRTNLVILALQKMCDHYGIKDYYIIGWSDILLHYPGIDRSKVYIKTCAELFGASGEHEFSLASSNQYVQPNQCHPNQSGHNLIAETLAEWIKNNATST